MFYFEKLTQYGHEPIQPSKLVFHGSCQVLGYLSNLRMLIKLANRSNLPNQLVVDQLRVP